MLPLSAIDAIGPAWSHTRRLLWDKRSWRLMLKIGAVAVFAQLGGANFNSGSIPNNLGSGTHNPGSLPHPAFLAAMVGVIIFVAIFALLFSLALFYLGSRLQFVLFEVVLRSDTTVAPIWRRYGAATWRWIGLKLLFFLACFAVCAPFLIPIVIAFVHGITASAQNGSIQNPAAFIGTILGFIAAIFFIALVIAVLYSLLHDFGLPSMALESTTMGETVRRVWNMFRAEPGQVLLYLVMRFVLGFVGSLCSNIILVIGILIACIPFGMVGVLDYFLFRNAGTGGHIIMILVWVLLGLLFLALLIVAAIILTGYVYTFIQAYALYFLGGRYPVLGQYLAPYWPQTHLPAPPPPAYQPPPSAPPASPAFNPPTA
jgi:hypothetical protein